MISETEAEAVRREVHANLSRGVMGDVQQIKKDIVIMSKRQKDHENAIYWAGEHLRDVDRCLDRLVHADKLLTASIERIERRAAKERRRAKRMRYVRGARWPWARKPSPT